MEKLLPALLASSALAIATTTAHGAFLVINDGTMGAGNYQTVQLNWSGTVIMASPGAGGNPDSFLEEYAVRNGTTNALSYIVHLNYVTNYNPSTKGAIGSLDASFDGSYRNGGIGLTGRFVVSQGSSIFESNASIGAGSGESGVWKPFSQTLTAAGFTRIYGSGILDFSSSGGVMSFGVLNEIGAGAPSSGWNAFDNLRVSVNDVNSANNVTAVPEPASLTLWGLGALGCAIAGYRRRKLA